VPDLVTVAEFGGWEQIAGDFFADGGIYARAIAEVQR
jgi:ABC-type sulfate transport system substrate-binding protein